MIIIIFRNIISGFLDIIDSVLHSDTNMCGLVIGMSFCSSPIATVLVCGIFNNFTRYCAPVPLSVSTGPILQILFTGEKGVAFSFCPGGIGFLETF